MPRGCVGADCRRAVQSLCTTPLSIRAILFDGCGDGTVPMKIDGDRLCCGELRGGESKEWVYRAVLAAYYLRRDGFKVPQSVRSSVGARRFFERLRGVVGDAVPTHIVAALAGALMALARLEGASVGGAVVIKSGTVGLNPKAIGAVLSGQLVGILLLAVLGVSMFALCKLGQQRSKEIEDFKRNVQRLTNARFRQLHAEIDELTYKISESQDAYSRSQYLAEVLEEALEEVTEELENLTSGNAELTNQNRALITERDDLQSKLDAVVPLMQRQQSQTQALQLDLQNTRQAAQLAEAALTDIKGDLDSKYGQVFTLSATNERLEERLDSLEMQFRNMELQKESADQAVAESKAQFAQERVRNEKLGEQVKRLTQQNEALGRDLAEKREGMEAVLKDIVGAEHDRNIASEPSSATKPAAPQDKVRRMISFPKRSTTPNTSTRTSGDRDANGSDHIEPEDAAQGSGSLAPEETEGGRNEEPDADGGVDSGVTTSTTEIQQQPSPTARRTRSFTRRLFERFSPNRSGTSTRQPKRSGTSTLQPDSVIKAELAPLDDTEGDQDHDAAGARDANGSDQSEPEDAAQGSRSVDPEETEEGRDEGPDADGGVITSTTQIQQQPSPTARRTRSFARGLFERLSPKRSGTSTRQPKRSGTSTLQPDSVIEAELAPYVLDNPEGDSDAEDAYPDFQAIIESNNIRRDLSLLQSKRSGERRKEKEREGERRERERGEMKEATQSSAVPAGQPSRSENLWRDLAKRLATAVPAAAADVGTELRQILQTGNKGLKPLTEQTSSTRAPPTRKEPTELQQVWARLNIGANANQDPQRLT